MYTSSTPPGSVSDQVKVKNLYKCLHNVHTVVIEISKCMFSKMHVLKMHQNACSPQCSPHTYYGTSWENLIKHIKTFYLWWSFSFIDACHS